MTMSDHSLEQAAPFLYREARALDDKRLGQLARLLRAGRRVLDAGLGRRRQADRATRSARSR